MLGPLFSLVVMASTPSQEISSSAVDVYGDWEIVGHRAPGISAMSSEEAKQWVGGKASYSDSMATFTDESCDDPSYHWSWVTAEQFFRSFRVSPETLGIKATSIGIVNVLCQGEDWFAPGSVLIKQNQDKFFTLWDGIFFELEQRRSAIETDPEPAPEDNVEALEQVKVLAKAG